MPMEDTGKMAPDSIWKEGGDTIIGMIAGIDLRPMELDGEMVDRIVLEIEDFVQDREGPVLVFFSPSKRANSKWGKWKAHLRELGVEPEHTEDAVGLCFEFKPVTYEYGGDFKSEGVQTPMRYFPTEEAAREEAAKVADELGFSSGEMTSEPQGKTAKYVLEHADGKTWEAFKNEAMGDPEVQEDPEILSDLADPNNTVRENLVEEGLIRRDEEGYYHVTQ